MTNEDIEKATSEAFAKSLQAAHRGDESEIVSNIADAIRASISQAYEEAAQIADREAVKYYSPTCRLIADDIRALKDSLAHHTDEL
jgi:phage baseplate assembly protein W